jgi:hypothetical protein
MGCFSAIVAQNIRNDLRCEVGQGNPYLAIAGRFQLDSRCGGQVSIRLANRSLPVYDSLRTEKASVGGSIPPCPTWYLQRSYIRR